MKGSNGYPVNTGRWQNTFAGERGDFRGERGYPRVRYPNEYVQNPPPYDAATPQQLIIVVIDEGIDIPPVPKDLKPVVPGSFRPIPRGAFRPDPIPIIIDWYKEEVIEWIRKERERRRKRNRKVREDDEPLMINNGLELDGWFLNGTCLPVFGNNPDYQWDRTAIGFSICQSVDPPSPSYPNIVEIGDLTGVDKVQFYKLRASNLWKDPVYEFQWQRTTSGVGANQIKRVVEPKDLGEPDPLWIVAPETRPPLTPMGEPLVPPYALRPARQQDPQGSPERREDGGPDPVISEAVAVEHGVEASEDAQVFRFTEDPHVQRKPRRREKEKKTQERFARAVVNTLGNAGEIGDLVEILYDRLPWQKRRWKGRDGKWRDKDIRLQDRIRRLYDNWDVVDLGAREFTLDLGPLGVFEGETTALEEVILNEIQDAVIGTIGGAASRAGRRQGVTSPSLNVGPINLGELAGSAL